jgi:hypothetical protein
VTKLKFVMTLAAVSAAAAAAQAAPASATFEAFAAVCAAPAADLGAVTAAADAQGWTASNVTPEANMPGVTIGGHLTRTHSANKVDLTLSAWQGLKGAVKVSDCTVRGGKDQYAAAVGAAKAWLAFAPQEDTAKKAIFRFTDNAGTHKALTSGEFDAAAAGAGLEILTVAGDQDGAVVDLMVIKK